MNRRKLVILESILVYISLGLNWGAIQTNRTHPFWMGLILSLGWMLIFIKICEFYANKDIKVFNKIKLIHFSGFIGIIAYIISIFRFY